MDANAFANLIDMGDTIAGVLAALYAIAALKVAPIAAQWAIRKVLAAVNDTGKDYSSWR